MFQKHKNMKPFANKKLDGKRLIKDVVAVIVGSFCAAFALHSFIIPNAFVSGGVGGISAILENAGFVKSYISYYIINIPLLIAAVFKLSKDFAAKTVASATLMSALLWLMEEVNFVRFTDDRLLAAVYSGVLFGIGIGVIYERGGSTGGSEIIANLIVKRYPTAKVSRLIMLMDIVIIFVGLAVFDGWSVVYAIICSVACERAMAVYLDKGRTGGMYYIITDKADKVCRALSVKYGYEGIRIDAIGSYSAQAKTLIKLFLPVGKEVGAKEIIKREDKDSFGFVVTAQYSARGNRIDEKIQ